MKNVSLARTSRLPVPTWAPEIGFSVEVDPEFAAVALQPRRVSATTVVNRQLLASASPGLDRFLIDELSRACSSQLDRICLYGGGVANPDQPVGIINTAGVHVLNVGVDPLYGWLVEGERLVENENISVDTFAYITSPKIRSVLRTQTLEPNTAEITWDHITRPFSSAVINDDRIFFGSFAFMTIGLWGSAADVIINPYTRGLVGQVEIVVNLFCSLAIRLPRAFGYTSEIVFNPLNFAPLPPPRKYVEPAPEPAEPVAEVAAASPEPQVRGAAKQKGPIDDSCGP